MGGEGRERGKENEIIDFCIDNGQVTKDTI